MYGYREDREGEGTEGIWVVGLKKLHAKDGKYDEDQHHDDERVDYGQQRRCEGVYERAQRSQLVEEP